MELELETSNKYTTSSTLPTDRNKLAKLSIFILITFSFLCTSLNYLAVLPTGTTATPFVLQSDGRSLSAVHFSPSTTTTTTTISTNNPVQVPAVLFFHGILANKEWITPLLTATAANGFHAFAIDQAGHGRSTGYKNNPSNVLGIDATALAQYVSTLPTVNSSLIHLVGWSMGGGAVLGAALNNSHDIPFRSSTLIGSRLRSSHGNIRNVTNLLLVCGRNDELIQASTLLESVASILNVTSIQERTLYGNVEQDRQGSGRKVVITGTDHIYEPADVGVRTAMISWIRATSGAGAEWSKNPIINTSGELYEMFSVFTGMLWISVIVASMALDDPMVLNVPIATEKEKKKKEEKEETNNIPSVDSVESDCCSRCCGYFTLRIPILWHGLISFAGVLIGGVLLGVPSPLFFFPLLLGWFLGMIVLYALQYRSLLQSIQSTHNNITTQSSSSLCSSLCGALQRQDAIKPASTFIMVFLILQVWLSFTPFDIGMVTPLFSPLIGPQGSAIYRRCLLYLFMWPIMTTYTLLDTACLRITVPLNLVNVNGNKNERSATNVGLLKVACKRYLGRAGVFLFLLVVLFVPLVFADVRVMGPFGFVVLFLVPFVGFTLITTFLDVFGERFGRAPLGTAIVMGGILANLVACTLTFAG